VPVHEALASILAGAATNLTFLLTDQGKPYTAAGFGNWFRDQCQAAGLRGCSAHGLRKAAARRLAEAGCSTHEIAAISRRAHRDLCCQLILGHPSMAWSLRHELVQPIDS